MTKVGAETNQILKSNNSTDQKYLEWLEEGRQQIINIFGDINSLENPNNGIIYHQKNINSKDENNLWEILQKTSEYLKSIWLETNKRKNIELAIITTYTNTIRHSIKELPSNISIYEKKEKNQNVVCVETINYIKDEWQKTYLENLLNDINKKEKEVIHNDFIKQITDRELWDSTKWVWLLKLAKKTKTDENPKPFDFQFEKTEINWEPIRLIKVICKIEISTTKTENKQNQTLESILPKNN
jgi:hypothetical protein